jgi:hypothetical protein
MRSASPRSHFPHAKDHHERHRAVRRLLARSPGAAQQLPATDGKPGRTGRHEPIRSSTPRIAARGAVLGITMAAGVASGINYLEHDPELALLAGAQVGSVTAGMAFVGVWTERRRMTRVAKAADLAVRLTPDGGRALGLLGRVAVLRALL